MTCTDFTIDVTETSPSVDVTQPTLSVDVTQPADNTVNVTETSQSVDVTQPTFEIDTNQPGVSNFIGLTDTPSSYSGQTGKTVQVNAGETALEFVDSISAEWGSITGTLSNQTDLQTVLDLKVTGPASSTDNSITTFDGTTGKLIKDSGMIIESNKIYETGNPTTYIKIINNTIEIWVNGTRQERFS